MICIGSSTQDERYRTRRSNEEGSVVGWSDGRTSNDDVHKRQQPGPVVSPVWSCPDSWNVAGRDDFRTEKAVRLAGLCICHLVTLADDAAV